MRIDSHQHFWKFDPVRDKWINESMSVLRRDFLPEDLKPILAANSIDGCVAVQADQSEVETEFLLELAGKNSFIKGVVGWVDLGQDHVEQRLSHYAQNPLFKGVRHIVQAEAGGFMLNRDFQNGISKLADLNLTYDLLVLEHQLPDAITLIQKFPNQKFVLDHLAKPQISHGLEQEWVKTISALASSENTYCKLSGMVTETENFRWKKGEFQPFLEKIVNAFGVDKLMFGSDWPVCLLSCEYTEVIQIVEDFFSREEVAKVFGENAMKFYNL